MNAKWALAALAALLLLPAASAVSITVTTEGTTTIAPGGSGSIDFAVSAECTEFLAEPSDPTDPTAYGSLTVTVDSSDLPSWLNGTAQEVTLSGAECITGQGAAPSATGSYPVAVTEGAPGMAPVDITLTAGEGSATASVQADYVPGYMFVINQTFPVEVGADPAEFTATIHITANARTMAMFEILEKPEYVSVSGFPGGNFQTVQDTEVAGGLEYMQDLAFSVTPPTGEWTEDKIVFKTWSHFLDDGDLKTDDQTFEWTFTNAAPAGGDDSNDSPGFGLLAAFALLGAAAVAARRS